MNKDKTVSNKQVKDILITVIIGVGALSLPSDAARALETGGWLAILLGGLFVIPFVIIINKIFLLYPGKTFFQIGRQIMHPAIFDLLLIIMVAHLTLALSFTSRIFAEIIKFYLLEITPSEVVIATILLVVAYAARTKLEVLARLAVMIFPFIIGVTIFLIGLNLPKFDYTNLFPIFNINIKDIPKGILTAIFSYGGYEILLFVLPFSEDNQGSLKHCMKGIGFIILIYLIVFFVTLSQHGIHQLQREIWPAIDVAKEVDLPGFFLENLDGVAISIWMLVEFATMVPLLYASGIIMGDILKTDSHQIFIPFFIPIVFLIALHPRNMVQVEANLGNALNYSTILVAMIIPTLVLILAYFKKKRGRA